jgi:hypothetical protein
MIPFVFVWFLEKCFNESVWKLFILLIYRMKAELEGINQQNTDAKLNTDKFLALTLPPSHNEGKKNCSFVYFF